MRMRSGFNPSGWEYMRPKLFSMSPAPMSKTSASAISTATSAFRTRTPPDTGDDVLAPSLSASCTSFLHTDTAGPTPNSRAVAIDAAAVNRSTRASTVASVNRGTASGRRRIMIARAQRASRKPAAPPRAAKIMFSAKNCRSTRPWPAPNDARIAISLRREDIRASNSPAILAQATSSTRTTARNSTERAKRAFPTTFSWTGTISRLAWFGRQAGFASAIRLRITSSSVVARSTETPGLSFATTPPKLPPKPVSRTLA